MQQILDGFKSIFIASDIVHPRDKVLIIADNDGESLWLGYLALSTAKVLGGEAVLTVMDSPEHRGAEPPAAVAAAMKAVNVCIRLSNKTSLVHTTARKQASDMGIRFCPIEAPAEEIKMGASPKDIQLIRDRTEKLAKLLAQTKIARVTTLEGTDITVNVAGRPAVPIHPLSPVVAGLPNYAEAAISPVEGTAEGKMVVDIAFIDWCCLLREPMHLTVKGGKVVDIKGYKPEIDKLQRVLDKYENARNIAELGIGTSHTTPLPVLGTRRDAARIGTAHLALGRNNDIGGNTWSEIHWDGLMSQATVELDGKTIMKNGEMLM
jgi:leucyl aminopeptidase (aminopeptidase T)